MTEHSRLPAGQKLFSFVVVADTHVNETEHGSHSPFATNALANGRARHVLHEVAALDPAPAFMVHLGDIVHPVPSLPAYHDAVERYKAIAEVLRLPVHLVPGNHDLGDKTVDWMPADIVCDRYIATYRRAFGADYYAFDQGPLRCVVINALLVNSGLQDEAKQRHWLEAELAEHAGRRRFLFIHYPPYVHAPEERSSYDNIDRPGRDWLLELLRRHVVEALFAGHVHNFWYDQFAQTEIYMLPSTAFLRHDYSEFYRVAPGSEFGRGDVGKFGYGIVDVHERGHVLRLVRTDGRSLEPGACLARRRAIAPLNPKIAPIGNVGVELRHPWAEVLEIAATGGVQEFGRKTARNDYPVLALWEMGARLLKIPDQDLVGTYTRSRMAMLRSVGHRFIVTALNFPSENVLRALADSPGLVDALEVNLSLARLEKDRRRVLEVKRAAGIPLLWSKLRMHEDARFDGAQFSHSVKSGLLPRELDAMAATLRPLRETIDGVVVRLERGVDLLAELPALTRFADDTGLAVLGAIKLADASLARMRDDDLDTARLAAESVLAGCAAPRMTWVFDTFMDVDRGYHPRNGFIDRRFNPRPAMKAFGAMIQLLHATDSVVIERVEERNALRQVWFSAGSSRHALVCGDRAAALALAERAQPRERLDLCSGEFDALQVHARAQPAASCDAAPGLWLLRQLRHGADHLAAHPQ